MNENKTIGQIVSIEQHATINAVVEIIWAKAQKRQLLDGKSPEKHKDKKRELLALVYSEDIAGLIATNISSIKAAVKQLRLGRKVIAARRKLIGARRLHPSAKAVK